MWNGNELHLLSDVNMNKIKAKNGSTRSMLTAEDSNFDNLFDSCTYLLKSPLINMVITITAPWRPNQPFYHASKLVYFITQNS